MIEITSAMPAKADHQRNRLLFILVSLWVAILIVLLSLQLAGFSFGFGITARGEDTNWLNLIANAKGKATVFARVFWQIDGRNPLSPWFWAAISPLISKSIGWLYFVRCVTDLLLAVSMFLLLLELNDKRNPLFAFGTALLVLVWNFFINYSQLIWVFHMAAVCSLLTILFYCKYLNSNRSKANYLALSLLFYLVSLSTYTLHSGAIIAVFLLSLFFSKNPERLSERLRATLIDSSFFLFVLIIFYLIWNTTSPVPQALQEGLKWTALFKSIKFVLFHPDNFVFYKTLVIDRSLTIPVFLLSLIFFNALFFWIFGFARTNGQTLQIPKLSIFIVLLAFAAPVVMVEATSRTFFPGSRSPMISQILQPLLYLSVIYLICDYLPLRADNKLKLVKALSASFIAFIFTISIEYNHCLVELDIKSGVLRNSYIAKIYERYELGYRFEKS
ncbi:hypothetical protein Lbir_2274 [Legionella birminghamensis]|uniref:Glycosyltransferase RgtA/B/C/D-like domain-containing protein n=1 Tax=Legionella birminghamensis TaxID=28083 RepID=A0A378I5G4_9GAMM|nr:hypothetical protein [Legionella birminghamensis]KTC68741.1 hypothetical protein Lbir_2274 [Legionella birminghamensis]STX30273.1 Uncharacterised protein [Legionella birminghamensis]